MAKAKTEKKTEKLEREYVIPLRKEFRKVPRYKRTAKAVKAVKEFLVRHMKIYDRDLSKIKIDKYVNEYLWQRGIKKPVHKIKVKAIKDGENVRVELVEFPDKLKFKKLREEKVEKTAKEVSEKKKAEKNVKEDSKTEEEKSEEVEKKAEEKKVEKEKTKAGVEEAQKIADTQAKQMKKTKQPSMKQPKRPQRKALAK